MEKRREFLKYLTGITAGMLLPVGSMTGNDKIVNRDKHGEILPMRRLGNTGCNITMLGLGGYHVGWTTERDAQEVIETAIEGGIRFFDNSESYGPHTGEIRYGKYLTPTYRDEIFLMSKTFTQSSKKAQEHLHDSLKRLKTDYLNLWQVHSLQGPADVDKRVQDGFLELFSKMKSEGKVKHIGFTGHADPDAHLRMLEQTEDNPIFETIQMPVNAVDISSSSSFIKKVFPKAIERDMGILAMKSLADGRFFAKKIQENQQVWETNDPVIGRISIKEALYFTWSLPVSTLITGAENRKYLQEKIDFAKSFQRLTESEKSTIIDKVIDLADMGVEYYKRG
ncbi:MAG: aldo/keto reductase [Cyclobacteriaceae bacterium]|nr:aldo/keto reductase [Cyclobacteriaceae bacterium]